MNGEANHDPSEQQATDSDAATAAQPQAQETPEAQAVGSPPPSPDAPPALPGLTAAAGEQPEPGARTDPFDGLVGDVYPAAAHTASTAPDTRTFGAADHAPDLTSAHPTASAALPPAATADPTVVPSAATAAAISALKQSVQPRGIVTALLSLAVVFGTALIAAILILIALAVSVPSGSSSGPIPGVGGGADVGTALGSVFVLACAVLGGGLGLSMSGSASLFGSSTADLGAGATVNIVVIGVLLVAAVGVHLVVRLRERAEPAATTVGAFTRSAAEALAIAIVLTLVAAIARLSAGSDGSGLSAELAVQAHVGGVFLGVFLVVLVGAVTARLSRAPLGVRGSISRNAREIATYLVIPHALMLLVALVVAIVLAVRSDAFAPVLLWLPFGANLAALLFGAAQFGAVTVGMPGGLASQSVRLWDVMGGWSALVFVAMFAALIVVAVRIGVRRTRTAGVVWQRVWVLPAVVLAGSVLASLTFLPVSAAGDVPIFGSMRVAVGPSWETPLLVTLFAAAVSVGAEVLPGFLYAMNPALLATIGGRRATQSWMAGAPVAPVSSLTPASIAPAPGTPALTAGTSAAVNPVPTASSPDAPTAALAPAEAAPFAVASSGAVTDAQTAVTAPRVGAPQEAAVPPVAAAEPGATLPPLPERKPLSPGAKRGLIVGGVSLGAVGLLVVGGIVAVSVLNAQRDPAIQARAYLEAIADGDATKATELLDPRLRTEDRALLVNEALAGETQRIEILDVTTANRSAEGATIDASYRLDGEVFDTSFSAMAGPKEWLVLDTWKLAGGALVFPVAIQVAETVPEVRIGDVTVPTGGEPVELYAYPGLYPVAIGGGSEWYRAEGTTELRVIPDAYAQIEGGVQETQELQDAVLKQVLDRVNKCVEVPTNMDKMCPYSVRQTDLDKLSVTEAPDGFDYFDDGRFQTTSGTMSTTRAPSMFDSKPTANESSFTMDGTYEVVDGKVVVDYDQGW